MSKRFFETNKGIRGGMLKGKAHYDSEGNSLGGIKAVVTDQGGTPVELEGNEVIINKKTVQSDKVLTVKGTPKEILSTLNQMDGNGVAIGDEDAEILDKYKTGGELIKRADGSYSRRGLWDNIRDNVGSGRKPTKQMLEQEAKIKSKYHLGGDMSKHLAPNGKASNLTHEQWHLVRSPEFKAWFGDWENEPANSSEVVDENGEPKIMYHGSRGDFNIFSNENENKLPWTEGGLGFYFTSNYNSALGYGRRVISTFINSRAIKKSNETEHAFVNENNLYKLRKSGFDAIYFDGEFTNTRGQRSFKDDELVVFNPNQIKLADGTNTTFDANNDDIRYAEGGEIPSLIEKGVVDLKFHETTPEHAEIYGLTAEKPLYIQTLYVNDNKRLQGIGTKVLHYIYSIAKQNGNDVIFGHINQKASFTKDEKETTFNHIDMVKNWLHKNGYAINEDNNDFHKVVKFKTGGSIGDMTPSELKEFYASPEGKKLDAETYAEWKSLVNMSKAEITNFYNSPEGKQAGLSESEATKHGIDSGRESAEWIMKMKDIPYKDWTSNMWRWAKKQISFIKRMSGMKGDLYDDKGRKTRKHTALLIWGHKPTKKFEGGGSIKGEEMEKEMFMSGGGIGKKVIFYAQTSGKKYEIKAYDDLSYETFRNGSSSGGGSGSNREDLKSRLDKMIKGSSEIDGIEYLIVIDDIMEKKEYDFNDYYSVKDLTKSLIEKYNSEVDSKGKKNKGTKINIESRIDSLYRIVNENPSKYLKDFIDFNNSLPKSFILSSHLMFFKEDYSNNEGIINYLIESKKNPLEFYEITPYKLPKRKNFKVSPNDSVFMGIHDDFIGNDPLRPIMTGTYFSEKGVVSTNAHILLFTKNRGGEDKFDGVYCHTKKCIEDNKDQKIDGKFPNYEMVIPSTQDYSKDVDTEYLLTYLKNANKYRLFNAVTHATVFSFETSEGVYEIALNTEFLESCIESMIELGHRELSLNFIEPSRALVITPKGKTNEDARGLYTDFALCMPVKIDQFDDVKVFNYDLDTNCSKYLYNSVEYCFNYEHTEKETLKKEVKELKEKLKSKEEVEIVPDTNKTLLQSAIDKDKNWGERIYKSNSLKELNELIEYLGKTHYLEELRDATSRRNYVQRHELDKGTEHEKEHLETLEKVAEHKITPEEAVVETAKTHIAENPEYYEDLQKMELEALRDKLKKQGYNVTIPSGGNRISVMGYGKGYFNAKKQKANSILSSLKRNGYNAVSELDADGYYDFWVYSNEPKQDLAKMEAENEESIPDLIEGLKVLAESLEGAEKKEIEDVIEGLELLLDDEEPIESFKDKKNDVLYTVEKDEKGKWTVFSVSPKWERRNEYPSAFTSKEDAIMIAKLEAGITKEVDPEGAFMREQESKFVEEPEESIQDLIDGLQILVDVSEGEEKQELEDTIEGLKLLL